MYQQLRTAHLERAHLHAPATVLYLRRSYDFEEKAAEGLHLVKAGALHTAIVILSSRLRTVEINEPLVRQRLCRTLVAAVAARANGRIRGTRVQVVAHAIENRDPFAHKPSGLKGRSRRQLDQWLSRQVAEQLDRISFGTVASRELYSDLLASELADTCSALFPELPAACTCDTGPAAAPVTVTFLGALDQRKGVRQLLAAWPLVRARRPEFSLRIIGKGVFEAEVTEAAAADSSIEVLIDPPRGSIHRSLRSTRALVLLSQPLPRWREQVGLPIVEALSHGCIVITTEQTGLSSWLEQHGHQIVGSAATPAEVAEAIIIGVESRKSTADLLADLPAVDGRTAADAWLFEDQKSSQDGYRETYEVPKGTRPTAGAP